MTRDGIDAALVRYVDRRAKHAGMVQDASLQNMTFYHLPDGPEQRERDEKLRALRRRVRPLLRLAVERHPAATTPTSSPSLPVRPLSRSRDRSSRPRTRDGTRHATVERP